MTLSEENLVIIVNRLDDGPREFVLFNGDPAKGGTAVISWELLTLPRAAQVIHELAASSPSMAQRLALSRLLISCLQYSGSGRHIVAEPWEAADLRGESLPIDTRTRMAAESARDQEAEWKRMVAGEESPKEPLAELSWPVFTDLPMLPLQFEDPELGQLAKELYNCLVPPGEGDAEVTGQDVRKKVSALRKSRFADLKLAIQPRRFNKLFKKLLAVAVVQSSQLSGEVAVRIVRDYLRRAPASEPPDLTEDERTVLDFRYGACPELRYTNISFFLGNAPLVGPLLNNLYHQYVVGAPRTEREKAAEALHKCLNLLRNFRRRRSLARSAERRENRQRRPQSSRPPGRRPEYEADPKAAPPQQRLLDMERLEDLTDKIMPRLHPRDARRVEALIASNFDRADAARQLGITLEEFSRQWRQTVIPNIRRILKALRSDDETK